MENNFVSAGIIAVVYLLVKFVEMRFLIKESKPVKDLIRDTIIVYISGILGLFVFNQLVPLTTQKVETSAFTGKAEF